MLAGIFLAHSTLAQSVMLHLKNGDRLSGSIQSQTETNLVLDTVLGVFDVPIDFIDRQEPVPEAAPTEASITKALEALSADYRSGSLDPAVYHRQRSALLKQAIDAGLSVSGIVPEATLPPPPPGVGSTPPAPESKFKGQAQVGTNLGFGTKDRQLYTGRVKLTHTHQRLRNSADYDFSYGRTDGDTTADRMEGRLKTDLDLSRHYYVYNLGGAGYDAIRRINLQYEVGPGIGLHVVKTQPVTLDLENGFNYYVEDREDANDRGHFFYRVAEIMTWQLSSRINLDERFEWFSKVEDPSQYRFRFESNLNYMLGANLSLVLTVLDQYDTNPAKDVDKNDLQLRSSVGLKF